MKRRVVITGLGTMNPLGHDPETTWARVAAGESGIGPITLFDASELKSRFGGEVKEFEPEALFGRKEVRRMDRVTQLALAAANQALADAGLEGSGVDREMVGVVLGCGLGNLGSTMEGIKTFNERGPHRVSPFFIPMMLADSPAATISITHGLRGPNMAIATACAAGNNALGEAAKMIGRGAADVILAGGAEAPILAVAIAGFNATGALSTHNDDPARASRPFDANRDGFVTGEGAAILVLEALEHALARGAHIVAEFLGYGTSADAYHVSAPSEDGSGAVKAIRAALADAGLEPAEIDYINAHGTGTKLNDKSETAAIKTVFGECAYDVPISSTKSMHGHLLGAAGALEALIGVKALQAGLVPPTINYETPDPECDLDYVPNEARPVAIGNFLSNGFGLGGHNATIIVGKFSY
ncbi:MAG: beta-ketoacyl-ACP synthase II [Chloroflexi bacterium]|nr:beta-ketoacyl-ACP synthase II [Chloroflexota bacterium]MCI0646252.1 beta-ketoacyl-ACP synthase II [Chloroflexota bacterium]MCI0732128.1 beta-ketoacyl-ACP synthase II [Chloroflexota bacterium]